MKWYDNLYFGQSVQGKVKRIRWKIEHNKFQYNIYLIVLDESENTLLRVLPASLLLQPHFPKENMNIVGIGGSKAEAMEVAQVILEEVYRERGDFQIESYMNQ